MPQKDQSVEYLYARLSGGRSCSVAFYGPTPTYREFEKVVELLQDLKRQNFEATELKEDPRG